MEGLRESTSELRANLEEANEKLIVAERAVADIQTQKEKKTTELEIVLERSTQALKTKAKLEEKLASLQAEASKLNEKIDSNKTGVDENRQRRDVILTQLENITHEEASLQSRIRDKTIVIEELRDALSGNGQNGVIAAIMKAAKKGGPLFGIGIRGRLGDLGVIAKEYDIAISSACGMLDFIVVDTAVAAEKAIEFLRSSKQGRGNFIALDQISKAREAMGRSITTPNSTPRIFDLITVTDEEVRPAFYLALKDTLVTADLTSATSIAYEGNKVKWRVVTMDGKVIDMSGAMTGGGNTPKSGGMQLSSGRKISGSLSKDVSPEMVAKAEEELKNLQMLLTQCRASHAAKESELQNVDTELRAVSGEVEKLLASLPRLTQNIHDTKQKITQLESDALLTDLETKKKEDLRRDLNEIERNMELAAPDLLLLRDSAKNVQEQIFNVGGPRLKRAQLKLDETIAKVDNLSSEISRCEIEIKNAEKQSIKAREGRVVSERDAETALQKQKELLAEVAEMEEDALQLITVLEETKSLLATQDNRLNEELTRVTEIKTRIRGEKEIADELANELKNCQRAIDENQKMLVSLNKEVQSVVEAHNEDLREYAAMTTGFTIYPTDPTVGTTDSMDTGGDESIVNDQALPKYTSDEISLIISNSEGHRKTGDVRDEMKAEISYLEDECDKLKGSVNMGAIQEYLKRDAEYRVRNGELEVATQERNECRKKFEDLRRLRLEEFMKGFGVISLRLKEMYQMITLGGDAELELVDSLDPFSGIVRFYTADSVLFFSRGYSLFS